MPIREIPSGLLWPRSNHRDMAPGAVGNVASYGGHGLDLGALRKNPDGFYEVLQVRTPTASNPSNGEWVFFDAANQVHVQQASMFQRYGAGWSYGPAHNGHNEVTGYFLTVHGREPSEMERRDYEHNLQLFRQLKAAAQARDEPEPGPQPVPDPGAAELRRQLEEARARIAALEGQVAAKVAQVTALEGQVTDLGGQVTDLGGQVTDLGGQVTTLKGQLTTLEGKLAAAQAENQALKNPSPDVRETIQKLAALGAGQVLEIKGGWKARLGRLNRWFEGLIS